MRDDRAGPGAHADADTGMSVLHPPLAPLPRRDSPITQKGFRANLSRPLQPR